MLIQITTAGKDPGSRQHRSELIELAKVFRAKVVDVSQDQLMIELSGSEDKVEAFAELARPYGIVELARTGVIAMPRGNPNRRPGLNRGRMVPADAQNDSGVDVADLPPG